MTRPTGLPSSPAPTRASGQWFTDREDMEPDFSAIQQSPEFARLRRRLRLFVFPMSALFFLWYMAFTLLSAYAHAFMSRRVVGEINIGLIFGLSQFASTIAIVFAYRRFAQRKLDPEVDRINESAGVSKE